MHAGCQTSEWRAAMRTLSSGYVLQSPATHMQPHTMLLLLLHLCHAAGQTWQSLPKR